jgi:UDP-N-acetylmuramate dehydrogenase
MINKGEEELEYLNKEHIAGLIRSTAEGISLLIDEPMKNHTSFKVGGPADILAEPGDIQQVGSIINICRSEGIPYFVMGNGTNLIVRDKGIRGVVVKLLDKFGRCTVEDNIIKAEAGILLSRLSNFALNNGLTGLEFASGIPGTMGGAVTMNAGAYGPEIKDVVFRTEYMDGTGEIKTLEGAEHKFGYRTSVLQQNGGIVLKSEFHLEKGDRTKIKEKMDELNKRRKSTQPLEMPSAGSVFRRPAGFYTGKLIQDCGLKGFEINGAQVSNKHCGFIVNTGNAAAEDIIRLIKHIQDTVKAAYRVDLQTEVKIVGEE